jgi:hypothetical protein
MKFSSIVWRTMCVGLLALSIGCVPEPIKVSDSVRDPSNPRAPEGKVYVVGSREEPEQLKSTNAKAEHEHNHEHNHAHHTTTPTAPSSAKPTGSGTPNSTVYQCPMHPDEKSSTPGNCSICGMKLIPVK